jgi:hypothetical protein
MWAMYRIVVKKKAINPGPRGGISDAVSGNIGAGYSLGNGPGIIDCCNGNYYNQRGCDSIHTKGIQDNDAGGDDSIDCGCHVNAGGAIIQPDFSFL